MCDYSLEQVKSRAAKVADKLVSTTFANTITRGFAAQTDLNTAVCLRPGTEIVFDKAPTYEHPVTHKQQVAESVTARFRQVDTHLPRAHHDALEFADGTIVLLTRLIPGQHATVLQIAGIPLREKAGEEKSVSPTREHEPA
jgi:hypothetical protein